MARGNQRGLSPHLKSPHQSAQPGTRDSMTRCFPQKWSLLPALLRLLSQISILSHLTILARSQSASPPATTVTAAYIIHSAVRAPACVRVRASRFCTLVLALPDIDDEVYMPRAHRVRGYSRGSSFDRGLRGTGQP